MILVGARWAKGNEGVIVEFTGDGKTLFTPAEARMSIALALKDHGFGPECMSDMLTQSTGRTPFKHVLAALPASDLNDDAEITFCSTTDDRTEVTSSPSASRICTTSGHHYQDHSALTARKEATKKKRMNAAPPPKRAGSHATSTSRSR